MTPEELAAQFRGDATWTLRREENGETTTFGPAPVDMINVWRNGMTMSFFGLYVFYPRETSDIQTHENGLDITCTFHTGRRLSDRWERVSK